MELFLPVFVAFVIICLQPGPYLLAMTSLALDGQWKSLIIFWLGAATAGTIIYFIVLTSFNLIPENFGFVFLFLKAIAAVMFVSMGLSSLNRSLSDTQKASLRTQQRITKAHFFQTMGSSFILTCSNPYVIGFIFAGIPAITGQTSFTLIDILVIRVAVMSADVLVWGGLCIPLLFLRRYFSNSMLKKINIFASTIMIGIGLFLFANMIYHVTAKGELYDAGLLGLISNDVQLKDKV
tara:strand:- start:256 stop:966 length:711 start_codon:yes stop_codon:yes gene_type:complete